MVANSPVKSSAQIASAMFALTTICCSSRARNIGMVETAMAPVLTIVISLLMYHAVPGSVLVTGMVLASISIYLMAE